MTGAGKLREKRMDNIDNCLMMGKFASPVSRRGGPRLPVGGAWSRVSLVAMYQSGLSLVR